MSNVPDDWGMYYGTCAACDKTFHRSGCVECDCTECRFCECLFPPGDIEQGTCAPCQQSLFWAWDELNAEEELATVLEVIDGGYHEEQCSTEVLHKIELLQASLAKAHERITKGFTAQ